MDDGSLCGAGAAHLEIEHRGDCVGGGGSTGAALAEQLRVGDHRLGVTAAAGIAAGTAIQVRQSIVDLRDPRIDGNFEFDAGDQQN